MEWFSHNAMSFFEALEALSHMSFTFANMTINPFVILKSIVIICLLLWLSGIAVRMVDRRLRRITDMRPSTRTLILKILQIMLYFFIFVSGMQLLGINLTALSVFGGALGVGIGFGLQKISSNFISGIILLFEKSIEVGDLIELADGTTGFVRRTNARYTLLETPDGRDILIPNEEFISQRVVSWTHSDKLARAVIPVTVSYDADVALARRLMIEAANAHPKRIGSKPTLAVLHSFGERGIEIHLYFWVADVTDGRMEPRSDVMLTILASFKANSIHIPYPQREVRVTDTNPHQIGEAT
jgi:small-conductance mechanosensitive channel